MRWENQDLIKENKIHEFRKTFSIDYLPVKWLFSALNLDMFKHLDLKLFWLSNFIEWISNLMAEIYSFVSVIHAFVNLGQ